VFILGALIAACRGTGQHIVALEEDVLNALFKPMRKFTLVMVTTQPVAAVAALQDLDAMTMVPQKFT